MYPQKVQLGGVLGVLWGCETGFLCLLWVMNNAPLMLSVSGARGIVGETMTPDVASRYASAFGSELRRMTGKANPVVVIGRDTRPSSEMLGAAAVSGLLACGCRVVRLAAVMTPTAGVMIDKHNADGGIVITASHNPIQWNGMKCLNSDGVAPPPADAENIIKRYKAGGMEFAKPDAMLPMESDLSGTDIHVKRVLERTDIASIKHLKFKVVLDSVNGAGCIGGKALLDAFGVEVVHINGEPTGQFAHTPEPIAENLTGLADAVRIHGADIGFAQDPDADRLAVVDNHGTYIGEEYTLVLAAAHLLETLGKDNAAGKVLVANLSTSRMIEDLAARYGATVARSAVGEANVVAKMQETAAILGGEGNGGVIVPEVCWVRDSLSGMAMILSLLARSGGESLSDIVSQLPRYEIRKDKIAIREGLADIAIDAIAKRYAGKRFDQQDGLRVDLDETQSWIHVRPSNTEPIFRIIVEAPSADEADRLLGEARGVIGSATGG